ncbi:MAG: tetratricopeptide repeat protein [Planctomycetes bacterium]|jgi:tetratricopeptide (TPR) repeat protein|nr:tetratricopeptide repeat protein [Planctomycetota bacterium]
MKRVVIACCVLVALSFLVLPAEAGDFVRLKNKQWVVSKPESEPPSTEDHEGSAITVLEENYDKLVYSVKVGEKTTRQETPSDQVDEVFYYPKPEAWSVAVADMEAGDYDSAVQGFRSLAGNSGNRAWLRMYSLYYVAKICQSGYQWGPAVQGFEKLLNDFPKSRFAPEALVQIGEINLNQLDNVEAAKNAFNRLQKLTGLPEAEKQVARYYLIRIIQKQGEKAKNTSLLNQALEEYRKLLAEVEKVAELKKVATLAKLGIGNCLIHLGKFDEALTFFQSIADTAEEKGVLASVFNGLGLCYFRTEKWKEALLAFLRVEVLYDDDPEQTAMSLFYSGKCFEFMAGAGIGSDNPSRARAQYAKCIARFGGTSWGQQASVARPNVRGK